MSADTTRHRCPAPRASRWLLAAALPARDRRFALADLDEDLQARAHRDGARLARRWYRSQVVRSLLPLALRRFTGRGFGPRRGGGVGIKGSSIMPDLSGDMRYAVRKLVQAPLMVITTVLSLGFGIGVATTVFTVANAVLLRPSVGPSTDLDHLVVVYTSQELGGANGATSFPDYLSIVESSDELGPESAFAGVTAYRMGMVNLEDGDTSRRLMVEIVAGNYFDVLSVPIPLGRAFQPDETRLGAAQPVVVISDHLWRERFGADPGVLGEVVQVDGVRFTVIGVAPEGLTGRFLSLDIDAWLPLGIPGGTYHATPTELADRDDREYGVMGRVRDGKTVEQAQAQLTTLGTALHQDYGSQWEDDLGRPRYFSVLSERDARVPPDARLGLLGFTAFLSLVTGMVLLIACSNVAGMFLARAGERGREMAIRLALGASRRRLIAMLLVESLVLGLAGGLLGVLVASQAASWLEVMPFPMGLALRFDFGLDHRVLIFAFLVSIATSVVFGLAPALEASRPSLVPALKTVQGASGKRPGRFGLRNLLVIGQVAFSVVFLVSAGLLLRTLQVTANADIGIEPDGIASMTKFLPEGEYPGDAAADYFDQLEQRLAALPEVEEVHTTLSAELSIIASVYRLQVEVDGYDQIEGERSMIAYNSITPGYMEMLGIRMLRGRTISDRDRAGAPRVAVVNQAFAQRYWSGEDAVGKSFRIVGRRGARNRMEADAEAVRVVGIADNGSYAGLDAEETPYVWMPIAQDRTSYRFIHVRARGGAQAGAALLQREVPLEAREVSLIQPTPYEELIGFQYWIMGAASRALGYLGMFALALAAVGIYGIVSYAVSRRAHEMAVRRALGALPRQVVSLVLRDGAYLTACGLAAGLLLTMPISALMAAEFSELSVLDPYALGGSVSVLLVVALLASLIPARRVTRIDPLKALRDA